MRKDKVVFDYRRISVPKKIAFGRFVITKMRAKELFADPYVTYEEVVSTVDKLEKYYLSSRDGSHTQIALMHQMKEEYDKVFRKLGEYVDRKADGDAGIILSSGFNLVKQPKPRVKIELRIERGDIPGTCLLYTSPSPRDGLLSIRRQRQMCIRDSGDAGIILSSGFNLVKQPKPRVKIELRIERGDIPG